VKVATFVGVLPVWIRTNPMTLPDLSSWIQPLTDPSFNTTLHDLRHEAVSRFFDPGLTIPVMAAISGQKDPATLFPYPHPRVEEPVSGLP